MDLCLVHNEVAGGATALELLGAALLRAQLLILPVMKREPCGGKAAVAGGASEGCQGELLGGRAEQESPEVSVQPKHLPSPTSGGYPSRPGGFTLSWFCVACLSDPLPEVRFQERLGIRNQ